jgi:hypothetical protein
MTADIQIGDVCLDLTQGRPVHVIEDTGLTAAEWSEQESYKLTENYGNGRLGATDEDSVFEVVYCSSAKSQPSKTYAMPESRLLRIETEAADDGRQVYDRVVRDVLEALFDLAMTLDEDWAVEPSGFDDAMGKLVANHPDIDDDVSGEAMELADVNHTVGTGAEVQD